MKIYLLFFFGAGLSFNSYSQSWQQIANYPGTERDDGVVFSVGPEAYCGTGLKPWFIASNNFIALETGFDTWIGIDSLPSGDERQYASGFSDSIHGYVFGGLGSAYFNDLWMYDPAANNWTAKTPMPSAGRMGSACFVINNIAYIIGGRTSASQSIKEVWAYDISAGSWLQKNDLPFGARWRASGASRNNKGYLIFGKDENDHFHNELYEYDPLNDTWSQLSVFPGNGRVYSSLNAFSNDLVIVAGLDSLGHSYNDMWRINPDSLSWQQLQSIPSAGRRGGMCFCTNTAIYYTTGIDQSNTRLKETWKVENPCSVNEIIRNGTISCYPNPADDFVTLSLPRTASLTIIEVFDPSGRCILKNTTKEDFAKIEISNFKNGLYIIRLISDQQLYHSKLVVQH